MHALRLKARRRIGPPLAIAETVLIQITRSSLRVDPTKESVALRREPNHPCDAALLINDEGVGSVVLAPCAISDAAVD
jgi:hypothetical protein